MNQRTDALSKLATLSKENALVFGDMSGLDESGAYMSPHLMFCKNALKASKVHEIEAFAPVATVMGYGDLEEAIAIVQKGEGSLVASAYTYDLPTASKLISGFASYHGRLLFLDRDCAKESTGHGSPMPQLIHGGPGRAGGGEELGGLRAVFHHCQKTAIQGSPRLLSSVTKSWIKGAPVIEKDVHPFQAKFNDLELGQTFNSAVRQITTEDVEHFAEFTGDTFFAHMSEELVAGHPFFKGRVAHGYLMLSFAAGLFVDKEKGAVLANYGLNNLRFTRPLLLNESIQVRLTVKEKAPSKPEYGEVKWDVEITTPEGETCAVYELLTMNAI
jgi:oxepin-CoA hydrolase/3-oxo-5,6-dehydrosuberyl-CoA semialdehyde dehydrogenase